MLFVSSLLFLFVFVLLSVILFTQPQRMYNKKNNKEFIQAAHTFFFLSLLSSVFCSLATFLFLHSTNCRSVGWLVWPSLFLTPKQTISQTAVYMHVCVCEASEKPTNTPKNANNQQQFQLTDENRITIESCTHTHTNTLLHIDRNSLYSLRDSAQK